MELQIRTEEKAIYSMNCNQISLAPGLTTSLTLNCIESFHAISKTLIPGNYKLICKVSSGEQNLEVLANEQWAIRVEPIMILPMIPMEKHLEGIPLVFCFSGLSMDRNIATKIFLWESKEDLKETNRIVEFPPLLNFRLPVFVQIIH
ncbi:MAG: hypothetical protein IPK10_05385 [Bacteroidetes bacterium]|nr:hypothetical protein [Bacteroidota bacterium]